MSRKTPIKNIKKDVSNEDYNLAYNNQDNLKIIQSVLSKYTKYLDNDTLHSCGLHALWRCLQNHNDVKYNTKFTSSLWQFVNWECKKELKKLATSRKTINIDDVDPSSADSTYNLFNDLDDCEYIDIIRSRFIDKMTFQEIGKIFGLSKETARRRIKSALHQIKQMVYNST